MMNANPSMAMNTNPSTSDPCKEINKEREDEITKECNEMTPADFERCADRYHTKAYHACFNHKSCEWDGSIKHGECKSKNTSTK